MIKWYKHKIEDAYLTGADKILLIICCFLGCLGTLTLAGIFTYILPEIFSGKYTFLLLSIPQQAIVTVFFIIFLLLTSLLCAYTIRELLKKEVE